MVAEAEAEAEEKKGHRRWRPQKRRSEKKKDCGEEVEKKEDKG